jgi:undecaprenyl-diphosphatase
MTAALQALDWSLLYAVQNTLHTTFLDWLMPRISMLGDFGAFWAVIAAGLLFSRKTRRWGVLMIAALGLSFILGSLVLKPLIARPRPCWLDGSVVLLIPNERDFSFPSGHTMASFAAAVVFTRAFPRYGWLSLLLAGAIAFSRLYLFVHFPSDVLAGMVLGALTGAAVLVLGRCLGESRGRLAQWLRPLLKTE